jgi:hypothetical protein
MFNRHLLLILYFIPQISNSQTCVVAKIDKNCIVVGADTRETDIKTNFRTHKSATTFSKFHKIGSEGTFHFAVMHEFGEESIYFARQAAKRNKTFQEVEKDYYTNFTHFLRLKFDSLKRQNERNYHESYPYDSGINVIFFFGYEKNKPILHILRFINVAPRGDRAVISISFHHDTAIGGGEINEIQDLIKSQETWKGNTQKKICELIWIEAKYHRNEVAEPIDMIYVTKNGYRMIPNPCK